MSLSIGDGPCYEMDMGVRYRPDTARRGRLRDELDVILPRLIDERTVRIILFGSVAA